MIKLIDSTNETLMTDVMAIWLAGNLERHAFINPHYWEEQTELVRKCLPQARLYGYFEDEQLVGFLGLTGDYIAGLFVKVGYRQQGIGTALLQKIKQNQPTIYLDVYPKNKKALLFYQHAGFVKVKEGVDQLTGEREYLMRWTAVEQKVHER